MGGQDWVKVGSRLQTKLNPIYLSVNLHTHVSIVGLSPLRVMEHLGTKDDIVAKFLKDNKKFDEARAEEEVMKFMLDREMVEKYIDWEVKKKEPDFQRNARQENFSDPKVVGLYAAWLIGGAGIAYFKNVIAAPKYASGEWETIHIPVPDWFPGQG